MAQKVDDRLRQYDNNFIRPDGVHLELRAIAGILQAQRDALLVSLKATHQLMQSVKVNANDPALSAALAQINAVEELDDDHDKHC